MPKKRWRWSVGPHGASVVVEEVKPGGNVRLAAYDRTISGTRRQGLGFPVRSPSGKLIPEAVKAAKARAAEVSAAIAGGRAPRGQVTVGELLTLFRREHVSTLEGKHRHETETALELLSNVLGSRFPVASIGVREWSAIGRKRMTGEIDVRGRPVANPDDRRSCGPRTATKTLKVLRTALHFGTNHRTTHGGFLLDADPTRGLEYPKQRNIRRPVADDYVYDVLLHVADRVPMDRYSPERSYLRELLVLAGHTGRRIGAIVALQWADWDPDGGRYGILRWRADSDKEDTEWWCPVTSEVRDAIEAHRVRLPGLGAAWMFHAPRARGSHIRVDVTRGWLLKAEKFAKLEHVPGFGWHALRRMWATKRKHHALKDLAAAGGWKDLETLQTVYQQADPERIEAAVLEAAPLRIARSGG